MNYESILNAVREYGENLPSVSFVRGESPVPVSGKVLDADDFVNLVDSSLEGWLTSGRFHEDFERGLARYVGVRNAVFVNSG